jgi:NAD(P)H dehydrogenase (quinone)
MKIGVTAASGRLGKEILDALVNETGAADVVGIARSPEKIGVPGIETRKADYLSPTDLIDALAGIDTVVLISAPTGPEDRVAMHRNVIQAAKQSGVRKMLFTSVIGNGKEKDTWYGPTREINRQTEADLMQSGLEWVIGRNGLYLELDIAHIVNAAAEGVFRNSGGDGPCCYISRPELAAAWAKLATGDAHNGKIYNLVGQSKTQAELVDLVNRHYGLNVAYEAISDQSYFDKVQSARGEIVARMITGCYQSIRVGGFDVESDYEEAAGRPPKSIDEMIALHRQADTDQ